MVATIRVLSGSASQIGQYFFSHKQTSAYYGAEEVGFWWGDVASAMKLPKHVERADFEKVLAGFDANGQQLTSDRKQSGDHKRVQGLDVTFSAPKSVSALYTVGSTELRNQIDAAMKAAVCETLEYAQSNLPLVRRGHGGKTRELGSLSAALFPHRLSRENDPQLHIHAVISNLILTHDKRWLSVNSRMLHQWTPTLGRVFRCTLGRELIQRLGVELERPQRPDGKLESWFEIVGVPKELVEAWSTRRQQIEKELAATGASSTEAKQAANLKTRKAKQSVSLDKLEQEWKEVADRFGFDEKSLIKLMDEERKQRPPTIDYEEALKQSLRDITYFEAHFNERQLVQAVCENLQHTGHSGKWVAERVRQDLSNSPEIVQLKELSGDRQYTTREMWNHEKAFFANIDELKRRQGAVVSDRQTEKAIRRKTTLVPEQVVAARHLMQSDKAVRVLTGVAGAGKSMLLDAVRDGFERSGYKVIGGAIAGAAKEELNKKTSIESRTVASYLYHLEKSMAQKFYDRVTHDLEMLARAAMGLHTYTYQPVKIDSKTVLVIDEAGMLDTRSLERLSHYVKEAGATLILCGDTKQLPAVMAGSPTKHVIKTVTPKHLSENHRQQNEDDVEAVAAIREGKIEEAIESYSERGLIVIGENHKATIDQVVEQWKEAGGINDPKSHVILAQTRADVDVVNERCQQACCDERRRNKSVLVDGKQFFVGDRVLFHTALRKYGVENGHFGTIVASNGLRRQVTIQMDREPNAKYRERGIRQTITIPISELGKDDLSLGYAATTHKLQGQSVKNSYLVLGSMNSQEMAYVQTTRAEETTKIFVDEEFVGEEMKKLVGSLSRTSQKLMAHDLEETKRQVPPPPPPKPKQQIGQ